MNNKIIKKGIINIIVYILTGIFSLLLALFVLFQNPYVQTYSARITTEYFSKEFNADIRIKELSVSVLLNIILKNVEIKDINNQQIINSKKIQINIKKINFRKRIINLSKIILDDCSLNIAIYANKSISNLKTLLRSLHFNNTQIEKSNKGGVKSYTWDIWCDAMNINNGVFSVIDENRIRKLAGVDFNYLDIDNFNLDIDNFRIHEDSLMFNINTLSLKDKISGFHIDSFEGEFKITNHSINSKNLKIHTLNSKLDLDFSFDFDDYSSFKNFEEKVRIRANIRPTILNMSNIGYFAPDLFSMHDVFNLSAKIDGTVNDFKCMNLIVNYGNLTHFEGNVYMKGLPDVLHTYALVEINSFKTHVKDIKNFSLPNNNGYIDLDEKYSNFGESNFLGKLEGFYNNFHANCVMQSPSGNFSVDLKLQTDTTNHLTRYTGQLSAVNFEIGKIFEVEKYLGKMNLKVDFDGSGLQNNDIILLMNGIVNSFEFNGNSYDQIKINGRFFDNKFLGKLKVDDENIFFDFNGLIDYNKQIPAYDFQAKIKNAHLYKLNFLKYDSTAVLSTHLNINFEGSNLDNYAGSIKIDSTIYFQDEKGYLINNVSLDAKKISDKQKFIELKSDYIDASLNGHFLFKDLFRLASSHMAIYMPIYFVDEDIADDTVSMQDFEFNVNFKNTSNFTKLFYPDIEISPFTTIIGSYSSQNEDINVDANANYLKYKDLVFKQWYAKSASNKDMFMMLTGCQHLIFRETSKNDTTTTLGLENLNVLITAKNDSIDWKLRWDDFEKSDKNKGYLAGFYKFKNRQNSWIKIYQTALKVNNTKWEIDKNNRIVIDSGFLSFENLNIYNNNQKFGFNGNISNNPQDTLKFYFDNWKFSNFDILINNPNFKVDGNINGNINLFKNSNNVNVNTNLEINNLSFNDVVMGKAKIKTFWEPIKRELFSEVYIKEKDTSEIRLLDLVGAFKPENEKEQLKFDLDLNGVQLKIFEPFIYGIASNVDGYMDGSFKINGSYLEPIVTGYVEFFNTKAKVDYLNVSYLLSNIIQFNNNRILFDQLVIQDTIGNVMPVSGHINHNYFSNLNYDIRLKPENSSLLNTNQKRNELFYGNALATGNIHIYGTSEDLIIDATLKTENGTEIKIPLNNSLEVKETDYIVFVSSKDTVSIPKEYNVDISGLTLKLNFNINEYADIQLFLPNNFGSISAIGNSDMSIILNPNGDFEIFGDYLISQGTFMFTLQNIVNRRFNIIEGGKISWRGNPYDALIDISTLYKTKASLAEIDPSFTRRVNVDCYLRLKEQLFNPVLNFTFQLPNVDESTRQLTYAKIDTTNNAIMNQQLIYLLVLGSFSYDQVKTSTIGASSFNLISNQLSNWLSQISKNFDIGINYRPGDNISREELEFALSTQLFDNRVSIDGNVIRMENSSAGESDIVGDVNIEVKLTDDGRFRIKAFNRSNVNAIENINEYDNLSPNTQGVGIFYRKEFNNFSDLFKSKKRQIKEQ